MINIGIINVTGYAGAELVRILHNHPEITIKSITGRSSAGKKIGEVFPYLNDSPLTIEPEISDGVDLVFSALPHKASAEAIGPLVKSGIKCIDLSADFRLPLDLFESVYKIKHPYPELLKHFTYGLPELFKDEITNAENIANPGCYPTGALIPLAEFFKQNNFNEDCFIIIDSKTGISGAGRSSNVGLSFSEINDNFSAYGLEGHRHQPEINYHLSRFLALNHSTYDTKTDHSKNIIFTPHLVPMVRGIFTTCYIVSLNKPYWFKLDNDKEKKISPFTSLVGNSPSVKDVRGTNNCLIYSDNPNSDKIGYDNKSNRVFRIISVIDNLVKGAAGQAVHNMNLMYGFPETMGLDNLGLYP